MRNEPNFSKSQMFITAISTTNYSEKCKLDTWSKRTQSNPTCGELAESIYGEPACTELCRSVEPTKPNLICKNWLVLYWQGGGEFDNLINNQ
jgi:hypothetical protein